jgi:undecaprenyl-diphosphatase
MQRIDVALQVRARFVVEVQERDAGAIPAQHRVVARPTDDSAHAQHGLVVAAELDLHVDRVVALQLGVREHGHSAERNIIRFGKFRREIVTDAVRNEQRVPDARKLALVGSSGPGTLMLVHCLVALAASGGNPLSHHAGGSLRLGGVPECSVTDLQALLLALLQGVSELFPVSSLGHTILVPALLHWRNINRSDPTFLAFVVLLHLGTALALIVYYRQRWLAIVRALVTSVIRGRLSEDRDERIGWLLVVGTIPVGVLGVLFQEPVRALFGTPAPAAAFLATNGLVMFAGEALRRRQLADRDRADRPIEHLSFAQSVLVGFAQSFALLPGISRSGASMVAGLLCDLDHEDAAEFSFLLATPVIFAAALLETRYLTAPGAHVALVQALAGGLVAAIAAYLSVAFLMRYFKSNDLRPFGWYCLIAGVVCFILSKRGFVS